MTGAAPHADDAAVGGSVGATPGPWSWVRYLGPDEYPEHYVALGHDQSSATNTSVIEIDTDQHGCARLVIVNPADAALIASAPAMLAALERIDSLVSGGICVVGHKGKDRYIRLIGQEVRAALLAARPLPPVADDGREGE